MTTPQSPNSGPIGSELVRDDPSFGDIVLQFVDGLKDRLNSMENALRAADFEKLRVAAHQLKGSGGGYGYPVLTENAAVLEKHAKNQALNDCAQTLNELQSICSRVVVDTESTS